MQGRPARPEDTLAVLILSFAPSNPAVMLRLLHTPHHLLGGTVAELPTGRYRRALRPATEQRMFRLPSPVSLRVNALVEGIHALDARTSRRQVVSAIILHLRADHSAPRRRLRRFVQPACWSRGRHRPAAVGGAQSDATAAWATTPLGRSTAGTPQSELVIAQRHGLGALTGAQRSREEAPRSARRSQPSRPA